MDLIRKSMYAAALSGMIISTCVFAYPKLNAGPAGNTSYEMVSEGVERYPSRDGEIVVVADRINIINCAGCEVPQRYPGFVFNAINNTRQPICFAFRFTMLEKRSGRIISWGNDLPALLKSRQTLSRFSGMTMAFGQTGLTDMGYDTWLRTWTPTNKSECLAEPAPMPQPAPPPATQTCTDGSVILKTDKC